MALTYEMLIRKIEQLAVSKSGSSKSVKIITLAKHFNTPVADIIVMLYEMEKWEIVKVYIPDGDRKLAVVTAEVVPI